MKVPFHVLGAVMVIAVLASCSARNRLTGFQYTVSNEVANAPWPSFLPANEMQLVADDSLTEAEQQALALKARAALLRRKAQNLRTAF